MGLSRNVSEIDCDIRRKSQIYSTPAVFCAHAEGVSILELGIGQTGSKN